MKLTKKEQVFLLSWLSDDLDLAIEDKENSSEDLVRTLTSIIKKLTPTPKGFCKSCKEIMKSDEISRQNDEYCISCL